MSRKNIDGNGFVTFRDCKFFCECVSQYLGKEIDQDGRLGLKPNGIYNVYRPKSEIAKKDFIESLNAKPLLDDHHVIGNNPGFGNPDGKREAGVLTEVKLVGNELIGRIDVWSPSLIKKIESGKKELSLSYACEFIPRKGVFRGERYDFIQSNLSCGNHLALVDEARNGHDCRVADGMFTRDEKIKLEKPDMDISKLSADDVIEALKGCSDEVRAKCKDFLNTPTEEEKKAAEDKAKTEEEAKKKAEEEAAKKAAEDAEAKKKAEEEAKKAKEAKAAEDAKKAEEEKQKACDAAVAECKRVIALAEDCKPVFGVVATDGIKTEKELAVKVCALDAAPKFLKDSTPESAVAALRGYLAGYLVGCGGGKEVKIVKDGKPSNKVSFSDYMANR